jgi:hypothetical protein
MYEMEGASQSRGSNGPIARPANPRNPPPSLGGASTNSGRLGARLRGRRLPRAARQWVDPFANSGFQVLALANFRSLVLADPEVSPRAGSPSLVACEISIAAERPAQEAVGTYFKILCDGSARPQKRLRYPQAEARCPPVVHQLIHTHAQNLVGTTVRRTERVSGARCTRRHRWGEREPVLKAPRRTARRGDEGGRGQEATSCCVVGVVRACRVRRTGRV